MSNQSYQPSIVGLRAFVAIAQKRHFGSAASALGVSQPSLSQALAALEEGLHVRLVERSTRRVMLTADGEQLLPRAAAAVGAFDEFTTAAAGLGDPLSSVLRVGLIPTVAPYVLPVVLSGLAETLPDLGLRVVEDQTARLVSALADGSLDVAILALPVEGGGLVEIPMYDEDFVLALPGDHPLADSTSVSPEVLRDLPLLLLDEGHCLRDQALEVCRLAGVRPDLGHTRAASLATAVHCVEGGLGVTLIPETAVGAETGRGRLATATFAEPVPGRRIGLVYRASSGRDDAYGVLARTLTGLIGAAHRVTPVDRPAQVRLEALDEVGGLSSTRAVSRR
ncbi:hydrogen peroxide-inducible genes activator [Gordonia jinhuaensis]|uniref:Probable hydrogen peroxide-inducible genes activator n=1 Tax=Gordonia jinhuaensis TaxID=1517702 RepID=A0A916T2E6_9ACTN|nr:hydrogen peroxide-inducible genes activator [Gordonia jinhuaensis]GGB25919.1 putative hydrogen peroxide-inducible genes activator [Gordonia jinhuaensis]